MRPSNKIDLRPKFLEVATTVPFLLAEGGNYKYSRFILIHQNSPYLEKKSTRIPTLNSASYYNFKNVVKIYIFKLNKIIRPCKVTWQISIYVQKRNFEEKKVLWTSRNLHKRLGRLGLMLISPRHPAKLECMLTGCWCTIADEFRGPHVTWHIDARSLKSLLITHCWHRTIYSYWKWLGNFLIIV